MAISRMQQPRQMYGLGSLVKSIGKGVKKIVKSPIGKAALLGAIGFGIPGTSIGGLFGRASFGGPAMSIFGKQGGIGALFANPSIAAMKTQGAEKGFLGGLLGKIPGGKFALGGALTSMLAASGMGEEEIELTKRDPDKLKMYVKKYFTNLYPDKSEEEIETLSESNVAEYRAEGGRIGFTKGGDVAKAVEKGISPDEALDMYNEFKKIKAKYGYTMSFNDYLDGEMYATGGRVGLMGGAMPTGIMRSNKAGTIERDYRETGGFVPVGIKEKADDVPAMLSKNEFVMTADAVRGMGGGNIEKGAQRLYDQMKTAEKRVV